MNRFAALGLVLFASIGLAGCEVIADIFQVGFWVGVVIVLILIFFIWLIVRLLR